MEELQNKVKELLQEYDLSDIIDALDYDKVKDKIFDDMHLMDHMEILRNNWTSESIAGSVPLNTETCGILLHRIANYLT